jgi:hypothetical protein
MPDTKSRRKDPIWITVTAVVVMLIGARLIRAYTEFGYNVFTEPFDPLLFLGDLAIHFVLYFATFFLLSAIWRRTRTEDSPTHAH